MTDTTVLPTVPVMRPWLGQEEADAAAAAVASGWVAQGPRVIEFERAVADQLRAVEGIAVSSCTTGLHLALVVLGIGPGDEVIVPSLSFIATTNVVRYVGATPVFADVDVASGNMTPESIDAVRTARTRAVMVVHQGGVPADLDGIHALCDGPGIAVIEDAACAIGAEHRGAPIGAGSDLVILSFHPRKVITTGEGGMVLTSRPEWATRLRRLREHGMSVSAAERHGSRTVTLEQYLEVGFNYRMTDIQAAVGLVQLAKLDAIVATRRSRAARYRAALAAVDGLTLVDDQPWGRTNYQSCWALLPSDFPCSRDELLQALLDRGVSARRGIMASHLEPACADIPHVPLPVTERIANDSLILPLFHEMTDAEQDRVVEGIIEAAGTSR